ncbi:MAG: homoserine dehydrogenase [Peptococcaceae bacterium]|jgi:homoserine dehydrogenase|nr:homoserine dehydrogenase [Peptococcaceae bacterium]
MRQIKIAVLGLGTVGQGVARLLRDNQATLAAKAGCEIALGRALEKFLTKKLDVELAAGALTNRWEEIRQDPEIAVVVETIGGVEPARTYVLQALQAGKSVVTANKDLLAACGQELFQAARAAGRDLYFEASVGAAIPIIGPLRQCLVASRLTEVMGIVNGTTNYILTRMEEEGLPFGEILSEARDLGFTEADPAADLEGHDAARKIAILATLAFHSQVAFADVYAEGIEKITGEDIRLARSLGYKIKLLAICRADGESIEARVHPALLPLEHPLARVGGTYNAIFARGPELGETMFYGVGTGQMPSAQAILSDVATVARNILQGCQGRLNSVAGRILPIKAMAEVETRFFLRLSLEDKPGALSQVAEILGKRGVSVARVIQSGLGAGQAEVVLVTHKTLEGRMRQATAEIGELPVTKKVAALFRVEE